MVRRGHVVSFLSFFLHTFEISFNCVGRGAFATRDIAKGGLVSPVPLVHLPASSIIEMHEIGSVEDNEEEGPVYYRLSEEVTGEQLLTNYLWYDLSS